MNFFPSPSPPSPYSPQFCPSPFHSRVGMPCIVQGIWGTYRGCLCFLFLHVELNLHKILKALFHPAPPPLLFVSVGCVLVFGWWDGVGVVFGVGWVSPHLWTAFPLSLLAPSLLPPYPPSNPQITTLRRGSHSGGQFSLTIFLYKAKAPPKKSQI